MAQVGQKIWFRKIGEAGVSSFMLQGIFVGHHDRSGAVLCVTKSGVVRGKDWTRLPPSDTNWDGLCCTLWKMVALELKWTKQVASEKKELDPIAKDCS